MKKCFNELHESCPIGILNNNTTAKKAEHTIAVKNKIRKLETAICDKISELMGLYCILELKDLRIIPISYQVK